MEKKIKNQQELKEILNLRGTKKVVFTNGCFDILHAGHVAYLEEAKSKGDLLIVALNSDDSVRRLKGQKRPINSWRERAAVIAGLASVDYVTVFEEDTPKNIIDFLLPDVLVKGGDWSIDKIVGADTVLKNGGKVASLSFLTNLSTSDIIAKILTKYDGPRRQNGKK